MGTLVLEFKNAQELKNQLEEFAKLVGVEFNSAVQHDIPFPVSTGGTKYPEPTVTFAPVRNETVEIQYKAPVPASAAPKFEDIKKAVRGRGRPPKVKPDAADGEEAPTLPTSAPVPLKGAIPDAPKEEAPPVKEVPENTLTYDEVRAIGLKFVEDHGTEKAMEIFEKLNIKNFKELSEDKYSEFVMMVQSAGAT